MEGDRISYVVDAHGGSERLARALTLAGLIESERFAGGEFDVLEPALEFYLEP